MLSSEVSAGQTATAAQYNALRTDASRAAPVGAMTMWLTDSAPNGWLLCYGQAVSRETYADLFAVIGTTFGAGDGSTTFALPDLRGRFPLGQDHMGGTPANRVTDTDADTIGGADGEETHTLTDAEVPSQQIKFLAGGSGSISGVPLLSQDNGTLQVITADQDDVGTYTTEGGGGAHNNMPPFITVNFIIKY